MDATFLDEDSYSYRLSRPALRLVLQHGLAVVLCSSKTSAEIEALLDELGVVLPFVAENGGAIFIPEAYELDVGGLPRQGRFRVLVLGVAYASVRRAFEEIRDQLGAPFRGFGDMDVDEVAKICGLSVPAAARAKQRQFDEAFLIQSDEHDWIAPLTRAVAERGLALTRGGRFFHLSSSHDKGRAVEHVNRLFQQRYGQIVTAAIGDSANDLPMLSAVEHAVLVERPEGGHDPATAAGVSGALCVAGVGPAGWAAAIERLIPILLPKQLTTEQRSRRP